MTTPQRREANRSRNCSCCGRRAVRVHLPAPTGDDPDFKVAVCPACDLTVGRLSDAQ
jgi:transposase